MTSAFLGGVVVGAVVTVLVELLILLQHARSNLPQD